MTLYGQCVDMGEDPRRQRQKTPEQSPTVFEVVEHLMDQWERRFPVPADARLLLKKIVREIVLDAAHVCEMRAESYSDISRAQVAQKCADGIRHILLCAEGESVCLRCDGVGCERCEYTGIKVRT